MQRIVKPVMPRLFRDNKRFSEHKRPRINAIVWFAPCVTLTTLYVEPNLSWTSELAHLHQFAKGRVVANHLHTVEVLFDGTSESDLVSPIYLESRKLTEFGKMLFKRKMATSSSKKGEVSNEDSE